MMISAPAFAAATAPARPIPRLAALMSFDDDGFAVDPEGARIEGEALAAASALCALCTSSDAANALLKAVLVDAGIDIREGTTIAELAVPPAESGAGARVGLRALHVAHGHLLEEAVARERVAVDGRGAAGPLGAEARRLARRVRPVERLVVEAWAVTCITCIACIA